jgi:Domain of unknown function (DUF4281)
MIVDSATAVATLDSMVAVNAVATTIAAVVPAVSPEPVHTAFAVATFLPQPFWLLLILLPNAKITKQVMGGM